MKIPATAIAAPVLAFLFLFAPQAGHAQTVPPAHTFTLTGPSTITETDADADTSYTVNRTGPDINGIWQLTLTYTVTLGTATAADFSGGSAPSGTVVFYTTDTSKTFNIGIAGDDLTESDETFTITFSLVSRAAQTGADQNNGVALPAAHAVTLIDDDPALIVHFSRTALTVGEGAVETYTARLSAAPSAQLVVSARSSAGGVARVTNEVVFTPTDWNTPKALSVTGVEDANSATDTAVLTHYLAGAMEYSGTGNAATQVAASAAPATASDVTVTVTDNDMAGVSVSPTALAADENGATVAYTLRLNTQPGADVTVTPSSGDSTAVTVSPAALTFTTGAWSATQLMTVTAIDDSDSDGETVTVSHALSGDAQYAGLSPQVVVTVTDDDNPGVSVSRSALSVMEGSAGNTQTYTVRLNTLPDSTVTVSLTSSDPGAATVMPASLPFTTANWNTAQTVTVTSADDDDVSDEALSVTHTVASSDTEYNGASVPDVAVTVADDDMRGVRLSATAVTVRDQGDDTVTYTISLQSPPVGGQVVVTPRVAGGGLAEVTGALTFAASNWRTTQNVTVTGRTDNDLADDTALITHSVAGADYTGVTAADVTVTITDTDTLRVTASPSALTLDEGTIATYTLRLSHQPGGLVRVAPALGNALDVLFVSVSNRDRPDPLVFSSDNWNRAQTVSVAGIQDFDDDDQMTRLTHTVSGADSAGATADTVAVTVTDDDSAGVTVSPTTLTIVEGETAAYSMRLNTRPSGNVVLFPDSLDYDEVTLVASGSPIGSIQLTFTTFNWNAPQMATVLVVNDDSLGTGGSYGDAIINAIDVASTADSGYAAISSGAIPDVTVVAVDNDVAGVDISETDLTVNEGADGTYTVRLTAEPSANVVVTPATSRSSVATAAPALTFSDSTWNTAQTVTVSGVDDGDTGDDSATISHTVTGSSDFAGAQAPSVAVTVADQRGVTLSVSELALAEGAAGTYTLVLSAAPSGNVIITPTSGGSAATVAPGALTFSTTTWNSAQSVTVTAATDSDNADERVDISHAVTGYGGISSAPALSVSISDDEAGVRIWPPTLMIDEGGTATYSVVLQSAPSADVMVTPSASDSAVVTMLEPGALTFTSTNWSTAQNVTVTAVDDNALTDPEASITHALSTAATGYASLTPGSVEVRVTNTDVPSLTVTGFPSTVNEGGNGDYTLALSHPPGGAVTVTPSSDNADVTFSPAALTFSTSSWNTAQTLTLNAGSDGDADDDAAAVSHTASGAEYDGVQSVAETVTITDPDSAGLVFSPPSALTLDEGSFGAYTIRLNTQPTAEVAVSPIFVGGNTVQGFQRYGASGPNAPLIFSPANWNMPQAVSVYANFDGDTDNEQDQVSHTVESSDANYRREEPGGEVSPEDLNLPRYQVPTYTLVARDSTRTRVDISPTALGVDEGSSGTYTVVLSHSPTGSGMRQVVVTPAATVSSGRGALMLSPASLTFASGNWNREQTVTVTGAQDDDGNDAVLAVSHTVTPTATVNNYDGVTAGDVTVTVRDDETAGITAAPDALSVNEGDTGVYTLRLNTRPAFEVTVTLPGGIPAVTLQPTSPLTFTTANWNTAQTVSVTGVTDPDGRSEMAALTHTLASADPDYNLNEAGRVAVTVVDSGSGLVVSVTSLEVDEGTDTGTYTVQLATEPSGEVRVGVASDNPDVRLSPAALTFTDANWNTAQTVTIDAVTEPDAADGTATVTHTAGGADYDGYTAEVRVDVDDPDVRGINVAPLSTLLDSAGQRSVAEGTDTGTYTVQLRTRPVGGIVAVSSAITPAAQSAIISLNPSGTLYFSAGNWNTAQTVTVTAAEDDDADAESFSVTHTASGADYNGITAQLQSTSVADNDRRGVTVRPTALDIMEGGEQTYTVRLATQPVGGDVMVTPSAGGASITVSGALTFTANNWNAGQGVVVTAVQDDNSVNETVTVTHTVSGADYDGVTAGDVTVTVRDDETAGITAAPDALSVNEGDTGVYTLRLNTRPSFEVTVTLPADTAAVTVDTTSPLTFTTANWNIAQTVSVTGVTDPDGRSEMAALTHTLASADPDYNINEAGRVAVTVVDGGSGLVVSVTSLEVDEGTDNGTYTVQLATEPSGEVRVGVASDNPDVRLSPTALTFTTTTWNMAQTVTVTAAEDPDAADGTATVTHTASGADYDGYTAEVRVEVDDPDVRGINVAPLSTLLDSAGRRSVVEGTDTGTYTVQLNTRPVGGVVFVSLAIAPAARSDIISLSPSGPLDFSANNWNMAQTVTVTAAEDPDADSESFSVTHTASGADYAGIAAQLQSTSVADNDRRGVTVRPTSLAIMEGGEQTYTVRLDTQPAGGDVTVTPSTGGAVSITVSGALTFTASNWNAGQGVVVTAVQDANSVSETVTVTHMVSGADYTVGPDLDAPPNVRVAVTDDDAPSVMISAPSPATVFEPGGSGDNIATYTVRLGTIPGGNVVITPSSDSPAAAVSAALTFTPGDWNTAQTVSVTAQPDANGFDETVTVSHTVAGADYDGLAVNDVTVMVTDDDENSVMVTQIANSVPEGGLAAVYSMTLSTPPVGGDVTVTPGIVNSMGPVDNRNVSWTPDQLVFTATTWNTAQTVFVTAVEDDDGADSTVTLNFTVTGADYDGVVVADMTVTIVDNDPPGVSVSPTDLAVLKGSTGTYAVRLDTAPHPPGAAVTVTISLSAPAPNSGELAVTPTVLTFDHRNWDTAQAVSVGASTDADSAAAPATISHRVSGADYGGVTADNVTVTIITSNLGEINEVILSEVARAMADQRVSAISNRISQAGQGRGAAAFSFGGQSTLAGLAAANAKTLAAGDFDLKSALGGSSFVTPLNASGGASAGSPAFWGGGDHRNLSGKSRGIEWDGTLFSFHAGLDARLRPDLLAGLMVSDSEGELDYEAPDDQQGEYEIDLTSVNPYIGWSLMDGRLDLWATAGYGEGDLEISPDDALISTTADVSMRMAAVGGAGELSRSEGAVVRLKGEAFYTRAIVDDTTTDRRAATVGDAGVDAHRARMTVEMESHYALAGGAQLKPSVEAGFRLDGGDGRTGSGLEVGGGLNYHDALLGFTLKSRARALLGHSGDYDEWGISASVSVDPGADGQGLSVALSPSYGRAGSGVQDIWNNGLLDESAQKAGRNDLQAHLTARLGYGLSAAPLNGRWLGAMGDGMLTPYSAMTLGGGKQQYRLGLQWGVGELFGLDLFATRQEQNGADDHAVLLKGEVRF